MRLLIYKEKKTMNYKNYFNRKILLNCVENICLILSK
jgi:hypothetical protein